MTKWASITCVVVGFCVAALCVNAQTQYQIPSTSDNLEQDYYEELDKWMLRAYEGDRDAQFKVGVLFASEQFDKPNAEQAVYWYKQAARQGHILAQYNLGHHLLTGSGAEKNEINAIQWWKEAAREDHALAQFNVGRAYYLGIGVKEDHEQSRYWFSRAAQNKVPKSIEVMQQLGWTVNLINGSQELTDTDTPAGLISMSSGNTGSTDVAALETEGKTDQNSAMTTLTQTTNMLVALYTDPAVRSVLISIIDDRTNLEIIDTNKDWLTARSSTGFPVWVHSDYLTIESDKATVVGNNVNARSVPIISKGTIVGQLNSDDTLTILDNQNDWYRLVSPSSFKAWIRSEDFNRPTNTSVHEYDIEDATISQEQLATTITLPNNQTTAVIDNNEAMVDINDNTWLFSQAKESYTLQLASFDEEQKVISFLSNSNFNDDSELHRFTANSKDIMWTYFLYGSYSSRDDAEAVKATIQQSQAWIRNFGRLQENRCLAWKTKLPTPPELNQYCNQ